MTDPTPSNDAHLEDAIRRTRDGDKAAFETVIRRFEKPLRSWLAGHVPPGIDVDEVAQRTFVAAYCRLSDYQPGTQFAAWLFTIARFQLRTETTRLRRIADYHSRYGPDLLQRELDRRSEEAPQRWDTRLDSLHLCLDALSEPLRRFVDWRYEEEIPLEEMAARCGRSVAAVKKQLWKARQALQQCVETRLARADGGLQ
ncbi:sigma-70 family RNA polymerase sigma factor [Rosistilla oblonga]|uniref:RNA polymerase sigma factor n=1 Tax=Rosistilla oblonga TaxID=2527990 RepID=A0A518IWA6_9BACT|nr:sigma-70 family RNA polymerase sigma factor [Rosistilla oblonga]QDV57369.1 ECF RNA polymerase sigma-E factor [Rosistilla oblonga]